MATLAGKYEADHTAAVALLRDAGMSPLTFLRVTPGTEATDGTFGTPTRKVITGTGLMVASNPQEFAAAGLTLTNPLTLLFAPAAYLLRAYSADFVLPGDVVTVNATVYTVRAILNVVAPDGYIILARIAVSA